LQRGQYQPRLDIRQDSLEELANSIKAQGVVQPIVARPIGKAGDSQRYEIVAGSLARSTIGRAGIDSCHRA
jgi:ParB family chromosome partitioning protein